MPVGSETWKNTILDTMLGAGHDPAFDDLEWYALFIGDPTDGGTEVSTGGGSNYGRAQVVNDGSMWGAAAGGLKTSLAQVTWPNAGSDWGTPDYWAICDASSGGNIVVYGQLYPISVITGDTAFLDAGQIIVEVI